ncbi:hypothetical protein Tco_1011683 [Tanacetum coccineum]
MVIVQECCGGQDMAPLPPHEQRYPFLRYQGLEYSDQDIADFKERLERIHNRGIHRVQVLDFKGMPELMRDVLYARMRMEHRDGDMVVVFTSQAWGRVFDTRGPLLGRAMRCLSWREFILALGLHTGKEMESLSFARYLRESERMILGKGDLCDYWRDISTNGYFLGPPPSYTLIRDLVLKLCYRMMAHSIAGRSQAPEKGLTVTVPTLPIIDMAKLVRLQICVELDDTWAWVLVGPARQEGDARGVTEEAPVAPGGGDEDEEMPQVMPPPPRTQGKRIYRLEEEVHGMHQALQGQREVLDSMARDFSRFTTWTITSLARLMNRADVPYTRYTESSVEYQRRTRQRTKDSNTSIAP